MGKTILSRLRRQILSKGAFLLQLPLCCSFPKAPLGKGGSKGAAGGLPKTATIAHCKQHAQRGHEMGNHCFLCWNRKFQPN